MAQTVLHIDFETRSPVDLKKTGMIRYFEDEYTDVWCAAYAIGDAPVRSWFRTDTPPHEVMRWIQAGNPVYAHNAGFEWHCFEHVMRRYGWVVPEIEQMYCTAAMAAAMSLPRHLGGAADAIGLEITKDDAGKRLMLQMAKPRNKDGPPWHYWGDDPKQIDKVERLIKYCEQDVEVERALERKLRLLSERERKVWLLDQKINQRGVRIDVPAVKRARKICLIELDKLNQELATLTQNGVSAATNHLQLKDWLNYRGHTTDSTDKEAIKKLMATPAVKADAVAKRVLTIRQEAGKSSTAKLEAMLTRVSVNGRAKDNLMYHAAHTGRWSGVGIQLQNLVRPEKFFNPENTELIFQLIQNGDAEMIRMLAGPPLHVIANVMRAFIIAEEGKVLLRADFSNIEGRFLAWLAGEAWKLDAFRAFDEGRGDDIYKLTASGILGKPVSAITDAERQSHGKVPELALGYQGGVGAFQSMAELYGLEVTDAEADEIKLAWRAKHPRIQNLWHDIEEAAMNACYNTGKGFTVRGVTFGVHGNILWCRLPSGRFMAYVDPQVREVQTPWGEPKLAVTYMAVDSETRRWMRHKGYGGHFVENIVQAGSRDVMVDAMLRVEDAGYPVVLTVHDEVVSEVDEALANKAEYSALMSIVPDWAKGLPLAADAVVGRRYGK